MWVKMGLFPLHSWLPNAYSAASAGVAPLIAPLTTKVSVYVMIRLMYSVFTPAYVFETLNWRPIILWLATIAIVAGSLWALMQRDLRRIICWIMVAEIGYMVGGAWLGVRSGVTGATYHLINDAVMTMTMFCFVGIMVHHCKIWSIDEMGGMFRRMPLTMGAFVIVACSMIGIPPTCGFFSKCYLLLGCAQTETWHLGAALIVASLCNAVIFYRIFEHAFFADEHAVQGSETKVLPPQKMEPPATMLIPLLVGAAALLLLGVGGSRIVDGFLIHLPWGAGG
jgi:multicomponent Na+:H+ antiporter subunit D